MSTSSPTRSSAGRFVDLLTPLREEIDRQLAVYLEGKRSAAAGSVTELAGSLEVLLTAGGKRLRPALVTFAHRALGGGREAAVRPVALATEMLHAYLLVHDDIMDHADTRRGRPASHVQFTRWHGEQGWNGDAEDFGRSAAILVGDLAHSWAVELYQEGRRQAEGTAVDTTALDRAFAAMCEEVIGGQFREMCLPFRSRHDRPDEAELAATLRLKSGRYSVERPIELGALLAGADGATREALERYGQAAGEAFQLQDDILGTFGDEKTTGKPAAGDLEEGKYTLLIHHTLEGAEGGDAERLLELLGSGSLSADEVREARGIIRRSGGLERTRQRVARRLQEARTALGTVHLNEEGREFFRGLLDYLGERAR